MSPIGDALGRPEESGTSIGMDAEVASSDDLASELSKMAENDSELAKEVEARLRGAKVRFDGAAPTIEAQPEPDAEPAVAGAAAASREPIPSLAGAARQARQGDWRTASTPASVARGRQTPAANPVHPVTSGKASGQARGQEWAEAFTREEAENAAPAPRRRAYAGKVARALPFVLIVLFLVLGFDRTVSIISGAVITGVGVLIVIGLIIATSRVGRKTTSMPRGDQMRTGRKRRLP